MAPQKKQDEPDPVIEPDPVVETETPPPVDVNMVTEDELLDEILENVGTPDFHLGANVPLEGLSGLMRLPDGTVVTCRGNYTPRHVGEHAFIVTNDGETVEATFHVVDPNAPAVVEDEPVDPAEVDQ